MKKKMISLLTLCALCAGASAQTVTVADVEAMPGETVTFALSLREGKADTYTSLQFNAQFPATGFATTGDYAISSAWKNASVTVGDVDATGMAVVPVSSAEAISGSNVDNLLTVSFTVGTDVAVADYDVTLSGITFGYGFTDKDIAPDVTFTVHVVSIHSVVLDENSTTAPEASDGAVNVRVKRTINAGEWSTLCLPFSMTEEQVKAAFGDDVQLSDFDGYEATEDEDECIVGLTVKFKDADITSGMEANHPYLIKVSSDITEFKADGVDIVPEEAPTVAAVKRSKKQWSEMTGTYVANTVLEATNLFISSNKFWYSSGNTKMKAFRAYFDFYDVLTEVEDAYSSRIVFAFGDTPSDISDTMTLTSSDGKYFDLQGRRVIKPSRGMYIKNGKKEIIK